MSAVCSMLKWGPVLCVRAECCGVPVPDAVAACSAGASFPKSGCWAILPPEHIKASSTLASESAYMSG